MKEIEVLVFGGAVVTGSSCCGCGPSSCCGPKVSMDKQAGELKYALVDKFGEKIKFRYIDVASEEMKDYPEIRQILNRVHLPLTVIDGKPRFHGGLSFEKISGAISELLN